MAEYANGRTFEYLLRDWYVKKGYLVIRSAGSRGPADLLAINSKEVVLIQCKKERKKKNYMDDIAKLRSTPRAFFIRKELWVKSKAAISVFNEFGDKIGSITLKELKND